MRSASLHPDSTNSPGKNAISLPPSRFYCRVSCRVIVAVSCFTSEENPSIALRVVDSVCQIRGPHICFFGFGGSVAVRAPEERIVEPLSTNYTNGFHIAEILSHSLPEHLRTFLDDF